MSINLISSLGLIADIAGVLMLFEYGLPSKIKSHGGALLREESSDAELERKRFNDKVEKRSYIGLTLILIGFVLQLIGTNFNLTFW